MKLTISWSRRGVGIYGGDVEEQANICLVIRHTADGWRLESNEFGTRRTESYRHDGVFRTYKEAKEAAIPVVEGRAIFLQAEKEASIASQAAFQAEKRARLRSSN